MSNTAACRFCPQGPGTLSSIRNHLDNLLIDYRKHRYNSTTEARGASYHPIPIILYARSKIDGGRNISWDLPDYTPAEQRVLDAFGARIIVHNVSTKINHFYIRCPPVWWMEHMDRISKVYAVNSNYEVMLAAVDAVMEDAERRMNDLETRQRILENQASKQPNAITIGHKIQGSMNRGDFNPSTGAVAGHNLEKSNLRSNNKKGSVFGSNNGNNEKETVFRSNNGTAVKMEEECDDESGYCLPPPRGRAPRAGENVVETISLLSSSPIRAPAEKTAAEQKDKSVKQKVGDAPVMFTLTFDVLGAKIVIPVTVYMTLTDTISAAVNRSVLKGTDVTALVIVGADGEVWGDEKWGEAWDVAASGRIHAWAVKLMAAKN